MINESAQCMYLNELILIKTCIKYGEMSLVTTFTITQQSYHSNTYIDYIVTVLTQRLNIHEKYFLPANMTFNRILLQLITYTLSLV